MPNRIDTYSGEQDDMSINLFDIAGIILRWKKAIAFATLGVMILTAIIVVLIPNKYRSHASILPTGTVDKMAELKSLAGLGSLQSGNENSPQLFPIILASDIVRDGVLEKTYTFSDDGKSLAMTPADYFGIDNPDKLREALTAITTVDMDKKTGVISAGVETKYPEFSQALLTEYLARLEDFNLNKRRSQARENAEYLQRQIETIQGELATAEDRLEDFQMVNLDWAGSTDPEIIKSLSRLKRDIEVKSQTYLYLVREHQVAMLDARKDVPIVRILDAPSLPTVKSAPARTLTVLLAGFVTGIIMILCATVAGIFQRAGSGPGRHSLDAFRHDLVESFPRTRHILTLVSRARKEETPANS